MSAEKSRDVGELQRAIEDMDCMATGGFSEIAAIAKLVLAAMEAPNARVGLEDYAKAFTAIWSTADEANDCVGNAADKVGCGYVDAMSERRDEARRAREQQAAGSCRGRSIAE